MNSLNSQESPNYQSFGDQLVIEQALKILSARLRQPGEVMNSPSTVKNYLILKMADLENEVFSVLFLDTQHCLIAVEEMFHGTLSRTRVYPREVVKRALAHNASAVILAHNHPSGFADPSTADARLTDNLKQALELIDVKTLDHIVIAGVNTVSFAERGWL